MNLKEDIPQEHIIDSEREAIAAQQRRKLTVAPHHVGDINAAKLAVQAHDNKQLSEVEIEAKGDTIVVQKTRKGYIPYNSNKVNQDRPIVKYGLQDDPSISLFGVMDGHGINILPYLQFFSLYSSRLSLCLYIYIYNIPHIINCMRM